MVGRAASVLASRGRLAAFCVLAVAVGVYYEVFPSLPALSLWWEVVFVSCVVMPAVFGFVYLVLPLRERRGLLPVGIACGVLAAVLVYADLGLPAVFVKLAAVTFVAWAFLRAFEELSWVVLVSLVVPWVDAYSVWRGPTKTITTHHTGLFQDIAIRFPTTGDKSFFDLGPPDVLFFALYLGAAARFRLRVGWTWIAMTLSFGATVALAVWLDLGGLPALPLLSIGFLAPNADLLWRRSRRREGVAADAGRRR